MGARSPLLKLYVDAKEERKPSCFQGTLHPKDQLILIDRCAEASIWPLAVQDEKSD